jgi:two-component system NarL family sensor kinase
MNTSEKELYAIVLVGFVLAFVLVVFVVSIVFLYQRRKHKQDKLLAELAAQYQEELLRSQLEIQEETMKSLAQELHDNIGQMLSVVKLSLAILPVEKEHPAAEPIKSVKTNLNQAIIDLANLTKGLHSERISRVGLTESMRFELINLEKSNLLEVHCDIEEELSYPDEKKTVIAFRIFQELLNNVLKHAEATKLAVTAKKVDDVIKIVMTDNGKGFNLEEKQTSANSSAGLGLKNLFNRAKLIGAKLDYETAVGKGTVVTIELPL